jgi:hypothetical protein
MTELMDPDDAQKRLDKLEDDIQATRRQVEKDLGHPHGRTFADSGSEHPEDDDQTIAP